MFKTCNANKSNIKLEKHRLKTSKTETNLY